MVLLDVKFLVESFSAVCHPTAIWLPWSLIRGQLLILLRSPCMWWVVSLMLHLRFFLLSFYSFTMCLGMDLFEFVLTAIHWVYWLWKLMFFIKYREFSAVISSNIHSSHFSLSSSSGAPIMYIFCLVCLMMSHRAQKLHSFFLILYSSLKLDSLSSPIFKFAEFSFYLFKCAAESLYWIFSSWWDIVLILPFSSLDMVFFGSLSIFKIVDSMPLSTKPNT